MAHKFLPKAATTKNPPERFSGDVWVDPIAYPQEAGQRLVVARVRFAPGAHTAWHSHANCQTLRVTSGVARTTTWLEHVSELDYHRPDGGNS